MREEFAAANGLLFRENPIGGQLQVALYLAEPDTAPDTLTGIAGQWEPVDGIYLAKTMERVFKAETGCAVSHWRYFLRKEKDLMSGGRAITHFFTATGNFPLRTGDGIEWYSVDDALCHPSLRHDFKWIIPLALDRLIYFTATTREAAP